MTSRIGVSGAASVRDGANRNVTVRNHPDQPIVLCHRQSAHILFGHHLGGFTNALRRRRHRHIPRHRFTDFHGCSTEILKPAMNQLYLAARVPNAGGDAGTHGGVDGFQGTGIASRRGEL
jgi:hypothetical protein